MRFKLAFPAAMLVTLVACAAALAAKPIKGATYAGSIHKTSNVVFTIKFTVSKNGTRVSSFSVPDVPVYCQGGGFGTPQTTTAKVTKHGTFTAKLPLYFAPTKDHQGYLIVTGKFAKHGKESGTAKTDFTRSTACNGSSTYSTVG